MFGNSKIVERMSLADSLSGAKSSDSGGDSGGDGGGGSIDYTKVGILRIILERIIVIKHQYL